MHAKIRCNGFTRYDRSFWQCIESFCAPPLGKLRAPQQGIELKKIISIKISCSFQDARAKYLVYTREYDPSVEARMLATDKSSQITDIAKSSNPERKNRLLMVRPWQPFLVSRVQAAILEFQLQLSFWYFAIALGALCSCKCWRQVAQAYAFSVFYSSRLNYWSLKMSIFAACLGVHNHCQKHTKKIEHFFIVLSLLLLHPLSTMSKRCAPPGAKQKWKI